MLKEDRHWFVLYNTKDWKTSSYETDMYNYFTSNEFLGTTFRFRSRSQCEIPRVGVRDWRPMICHKFSADSLEIKAITEYFLDIGR